MFSRAAIARASAPPLRSAAVRRTCQRFQSTASSSVQQGGNATSHAIAGVAGGGVVVLVGYTWYHFSGLKTAVKASKQVQTYMETARNTVVEKAKQSASSSGDALAYLRNVAKSYSALVPGASGYVDMTFDSLDQLHETHGPEMDDILKGAKDEITKAVQNGGADVATAAAIYEILRRRVAELQELGKKVSGDVLDNFPQVRERLGDGYSKLEELVESRGPEAKKIFDETKKQLKEMISKGKLNSDSIDQARQLLQEKTAQIQKMAATAGATGGMSLDGGWEKLQAFVKTIPGGEEQLKKMPHVKDFMDVAEKRGDDAKQLAVEAYREILGILEKKGQEAQKLAKETKNEAKETKGQKKD